MPIISTLLNNDWYKLTMPPVVRAHYPGTYIGAGFTNRNTDFPVATYVDIGELREELGALRELRYTQRELTYLESLGAINPTYLERLQTYQMPAVHAEVWGNQIVMEAAGIWDEIMPVEIPALQIITELTSRKLAVELRLTPADIRRELYRGLDELVALMRANPTKKLALFGTRRHFSVDVEYEATAYLVRKIPNQIAGISNVRLAMEFGYPVSGTIAHEYFIVPTMIQIALGTPNPIGFAQNQAMDFWEQEYLHIWNGTMLCAIPDTFGTDSFLRHLTSERAEKWLVFKQDSGRPQVFVNKVTAWLTEHDKDPARYRINHTDGLDVATMAELFRFADHHPTGYMDGYGLGTKSTNNVGVPTHSYIWKPIWVMVDGQKIGAGKLTDNLAKASGGPETVQQLKQLAGYTNTFCELQTV